MSEKALKIVPAAEAKTRPEVEAPETAASTPAPRKTRKRGLRFVLLLVLPLIAVIGGGWFYLSGGRYIETDNAYVGAQKVLITPDISGQIVHVAVREGQHVKPGDELFTLDKKPYQLALDAARAKLSAARTDYEKLKTTLASLDTLAELAERNAALKHKDVERKQKLLSSQAGSQADVDTAMSAMVTAQLQAQFTKQQRATTLSQLLGNPNLPIEEFPEYVQAKSAVDNAERDLAHTTVRAPMAGTATQVDNIQLGRFVAAGTPVLSVIDDENPWVDANPKETDITYLRVGQKATLDVDSFPNHTFTGHVVAVSPGTGAQFSILPPQNASGNWVKVVQRVPVRIAFDKDEDTHLLRAGMSVNVAIDTHYSRWPAWLGGGAKAKDAAAK
jgi:membrane fusion protein (multidrug efflux system)